MRPRHVPATTAPLLPACGPQGGRACSPRYESYCISTLLNSNGKACCASRSPGGERSRTARTAAQRSALGRRDPESGRRWHAALYLLLTQQPAQRRWLRGSCCLCLCSPSDTNSWGCPRSEASSISPSSCTRMPWWSTFLPGMGVTLTWRHVSIAEQARCTVQWRAFAAAGWPTRPARYATPALQPQRAAPPPLPPHLPLHAVLVGEERQRLGVVLLGLHRNRLHWLAVTAPELQLHRAGLAPHDAPQPSEQLVLRAGAGRSRSARLKMSRQDTLGPTHALTMAGP